MLTLEKRKNKKSQKIDVNELKKIIIVLKKNIVITLRLIEFSNHKFIY
jgi:hypothetical protein